MVGPGALIAAGTAWAGAWTRPIGHAYARLGTDVYHAERFVGPGGEPGEAAGGAYTGVQVTAYTEVGLGPERWPFQLGVGLPVVAGRHRTTLTSVVGEIGVAASSTRLGDLRLTPQVALHPRLPLAVAVETKIPLYANDGVGGLAGPHELFPKPGDGQVDVTPELLAGVARGAWFAEGLAGYRHRTESFVHYTTDAVFSDAVVAVVKGGFRAGPALPILSLDATRSLRRDDVSREALTGAISGLVDVVPDTFAIEARAAAELWARNTSRGWGLGLGVSYRR